MDMGTGICVERQQNVFYHSKQKASFQNYKTQSQQSRSYSGLAKGPLTDVFLFFILI